MGTLTMLRVWVLSVVTILNGLPTEQSGIMADSYESIRGINMDHNMQVCSTWGNFHFSTFDGQFFQLPYTCNYILTTLCDSTKSDFNIQMRRKYINNLPTISSFTIKIEGVVIQLLDGNITMNQIKMVVPSYKYGIRIERIASFIKISSKLGLTVLWDEHNSLSIEISKKYSGQTCGLCGDFDGFKDNEFTENGEQLTSQHYGLKWKMDAPTETCEEIELHDQECKAQRSECVKLLSDPAFSSCHSLLSIKAFVEACVRDMCQCNSSLSVCLCDTLSEFSRQCAHAGGRPQSWRRKGLCAKECPFNLEHSECRNPCKDTCSNQEGSQVCGDHCVEGCFCPSGTVLNNIEKNGCIPAKKCPCIHNGQIYQPGESFNRTCQECVCSDGRWRCVSLDCPGTCSLQGGSHIITYDGKAYTFHGNCYYVLSKDRDVTVLGKLVQCGQTDTETCLTEVKFIIPSTTVTFLSTGTILVNDIATKLPVFIDQVKIFKPSTFYIIADTASLQLVIQMVPIMQAYIVANSEKKRRLTGLCGNFNDVQEDDFKTESGLIEGTAATFANTWKVMTTCPDVSNCHQDPCSMSVEKETYAKEWCSLLTSPEGDFSSCHVEVSPVPYKDRCVYDTCKCAKSEECMCAAVSSYVHACAAKGVLLQDWRNTICEKFSMDCPGNMVYTYSLNSCGTTCRSLSGYDHTCQVTHTPVDGCGCAKGTYLNDQGKCVPASSCPCYYNDQVVAPSQVISKDGTTCTCTHGKLECLGIVQIDCSAPMYFFNCSNAGPEAKGAECQRSCQTLDSGQCVNTPCTSGCVCPNGQLSDGQGGCVEEKECPCVHNGVYYRPGETVKEDCNTCTCRNRKFHCTSNKCPSTCTIYGDGHYMTFDSMRYSFSGGCEYMVAQDYCINSPSSSFRIITENIPCGTTGTTCSKSVKVYLGNKEFVLSEEKIKVFNYDNGTEIPYKIYTVGIYFVIEASNGLVLHWDKKTTVKITLDPLFKGKVCGLCGNYDGNGKNDFVTRGGEEVVEPLQFGNSWRVFSTCPKASIISNPCDMRPHRQAWAIKQCSIIKSDVFSLCHSLVDPAKYYDICVQDTCACDSGGDCECFCTAVAAYAAACNEKGACISWRSPTICPLCCDYYNLPGGCEWHYQPCGQCVKTCSNPSGECFNQMLVEGCFPKCPPDRPYINETTMKCETCSAPPSTTTTQTTTSPTQESSTTSVTVSPTTGKTTPVGSTSSETTSLPPPTTTQTTTGPTQESSTSVTVSPTTSKTPPVGSTSSETTHLPPTTTTTQTTTGPTQESSTSVTVSPTTGKTPPPPNCMDISCQWSEWLDTSYPDTSINTGDDIESIAAMWESGIIACKEPKMIKCRAKDYKNDTLEDVGQKVTCNTSFGLLCDNIDQNGPPCYNYEIQVQCCNCNTNISTTTITTQTTTGPTQESSTMSPTAGKTTPVGSTSSETTRLPPPTTTTTTQTTTGPIQESSTTSVTVSPTTSKTPPVGSTSSETTRLPPTTTTQTTTGPTQESSTTSVTVSPTTSKTPPPPNCMDISCQWSEWLDTSYPDTSINTGDDIESIAAMWESGIIACKEPKMIKCRAKDYKNDTLEEVGQKVTCNTSFGLLCDNIDQNGPPCYNYEIQVQCCNCSTNISTTTITTQTTTGPTQESSTTSVTVSPTTGKTTLVGSTSSETTRLPPPTTPQTTTGPTQESSTMSPTTGKTTPVGSTSSETTRLPPPTTTQTTTGPTQESSTMSPTTGKTTLVGSTSSETTSLPPKTTTPQTTTGPTQESSTTSVTVSPTTGKTTPVGSTSSETTRLPATTTTQTTTGPSQESSTTSVTVSPTTSKTPPVGSTSSETTHLPPPTTTQTTTGPTQESSTTSVTVSPTTGKTPPPPNCMDISCQWSEWLDTSYPDTSINTGDDIESIAAMWESGIIACKEPKMIKCRAKDYKNDTLEEVGQKVTCNTSFGLLCDNIDQNGPPCYNYEIQVQCCNCSTNISTTTITTQTTTSPTQESSTTSVTVSPTTGKTTLVGSTSSETTRLPPPTTTQTTTGPTQESSTMSPTTGKTTPVGSTSSETTRLPPPPTTQTTTGPTLESSTMSPTTGKTTLVGSTSSETTSLPPKTTTAPQTTTGPTQESSTTSVTVSPTTGKTTPVGSTSSETTHLPPPTTTQTTTGPTQESSTTSVTVSPTTGKTTPVGSTSSETTHLPPPTTTQTTTGPTQESSTTSVTVSPTTGKTPPPPNCMDISCQWSEWLDTSYPDTSINTGDDIESIAAMWESGIIACKEPKMIKCRAKDYKNDTLEEVGQKVTCNTSFGLLCDNIDQNGPPCYNYEIQVQCCNCSTNISTTTITTQTTTSPTQESSTTSVTVSPTTGKTTPVGSTSSETTHLPPPTTTQTTTGPTQESSTTSVTVSPTTGKTTPVGSTSSETTHLPPPTTTQTTTGPTQESSPTSVTVSPTTGKTPPPPNCMDISCQWSEWLDTSYPDTSINTGDDIESIAAMWESGIIACKEPKMIKCRAKDYKNDTLEEVGQKVTCNTSFGLLCDNIDQNGPPCYNYEIQVQCCNCSTNISTTTITTQTTTGPTQESSTTSVTVSPTTGKTTPVGSTSSETTRLPPTTTTQTTTGPTQESSTSVTVSPTPVGSTSGPSITSPSTTEMTPTTISITPSTSTNIVLTTTEVPSTTLAVSTPARTSTLVPITSAKTTQSTFHVITKTETITKTPDHQVVNTTTPCVCTYETKTFRPGSFMYNEVNVAGQCFKVDCGSACEVLKTAQPCPSTPLPSTKPPTTTVSEPTTTITSTSTPLPSTKPPTTTVSEPTTTITSTPKPPKDCQYLDPPRKNGETWTEDCLVKKCIDGYVNMTFVCNNSHPSRPVCENPNSQPEKVKNGCCFDFECPCKCMGWGDPHYVTFDGQYYAFQGNCTYVLVQEIIKKYNFSVHITNYYCNQPQGLACPESLTVYYNSDRIDLKQKRNPTVNTVLVNNVTVKPTFSNAHFTITSTGIKMIVNIPAIKAEIIFSGMNFLVTLPFSLFHHNTEGQCGFCDNNRTNDCRLPKGQIESCETMAGAWIVNNTRCTNVPPSPPPPPPPPPPPLPPPSICEVINSTVFEKCHNVSSPEPFYKACIYDVNGMGNASGCFSLESYASSCAEASVCVDWRNSTKGLCEYKCPSPKVYQACGSKVEETCNSKYNNKFVNCENRVCEGFKEGCFCPNGTTLFDTASGECTSFCGCVGPDGLPRKPGDKWLMNCQECVCSAENMGPVCTPVQCPVRENCNKPGYEIKKDGCCEACVKKQVCVFNNKEYLPGAKVPGDICKDCICGSTEDPKTGLRAVECSEMTCDKTCPQGFVYVPESEKCCGKCVQLRCVYTGPDNTVHTIEDGKSFTPPNENCMKYNCTKVNNAFVLVPITQSCPAFKQEDCVPGTVRTTPDGCCKTCELQNCLVQKNTTFLVADSCTSVEPVEITSCSGSCDTSSIYLMAVNTMMHHCSCCQEMRTSSRQVKMNCPGQEQNTYTYTYVEECGCHVTECQDKKSSK